jgi:hypothetical protein
VDELDSDDTSQVGVGGLVDGRHSTLAEEVFDLVATADGLSEPTGCGHDVEI